MSSTRIQIRRDTATNWYNVNPQLASGEIGFETDTGKFKIGNGTNIWRTLEYASILPSGISSVAVTSFNTRHGAVTLTDTDVNTALGYTAADAADLSGFQSSTNTDITNAINTAEGYTDTSIENLNIGTNGAGNVVSTDGTQTLTNKTLGSSTSLGENLDANSKKILNLADPEIDSDASNKGYVDTVIENVYHSIFVNFATTEPIDAINDDGEAGEYGLGIGGTLTGTSNGPLTVDGVIVDLSDRILFKDQADAKQNGVYYISTAGDSGTPWVATRTTDYDNSFQGQLIGGRTIFVGEGHTLSATTWFMDALGTSETPAYAIVIGTDNITFQQSAGSGTYVAGNGLNLSGSSFSINTDVVQTRVSGVSDTEIGYLDGVTSAIQTQLNSKANLAGPTFTGTVTLPSTTSIGNVSSTELGYVDGVTSSIQTQLDSKANLSGATFTGAISGTSLTLSGDLTVNGTTTTINSTTLTVDDKNIELGSVASPTDTTANGGGITLKGTTDKTFAWASSGAAWQSSENIEIASNKTYKINGTDVLSSSRVLGKTIGGTSAGDIVSIDATQTLTNKTLGGTTITGDVTITSTNNSNSTTSGALVVDGGIGVAKDLHVGGVGIFGDEPTVTLSNAVAYFDKTADGAIQVGMQNPSTGTSASSDFVATADNGNDTSHYLDLGINNSNYSDSAFSATSANDGYLIVDGGNLVLDVSTGGKSIVFAVGGTQSTDIVGTWNETDGLDVKGHLKVDGTSNLVGQVTLGDGLVATDITATSVEVTAGTSSTVATTIKGYSGQTANLTQWKNSSGTTLASVDAAGNITAPTFSGTSIGNLSYYATNNTGSTITKGTPVYITGLDTNNNPTIAPALVSDPSKMPAAGIVPADIANGVTAQVVFVGQIGGLDTSALTVGAVLYVGTSGLTTTKPTNTSYSVQPIGQVEKSSATTGRILVNCTGTTVDVPNVISIPGNITTTSGNFTGSGSGLTTLNASNLSSGTVPSARLSLTSSDIPSLTHSKISDFQTTVLGYTLDQFAAPVDNVAMGGYRITNLGTPTQSGDAANKSYVDALTTGLSIKQAVNYATAAVLPNTPTYANGTADQSQGTGIGATLTGSGNHTLQVDGVNVTNNQRILVKNQATATQNGIYVVTNAGAAGGGGSAWILTRSSDADNSIAGELRPNAYVSVLAGNTNIGTSWVITGTGTATTPAGAIKIGTDSITFSQFNGAASYVAGAGLTLTGLTFDVNTASSDRIVVNADNIDLALVTRSDSTAADQGNRVIAVTTDSYGRVTGVTTGAQVTATTSVKGIASFDSGDFSVASGAVSIKTGGVDNNQLANSSLTIGSTNISLGATQTSLAGLSSVTSTSFSGNLTGNVTGNASTVTNGVYTTDTGTVTNTMLAGSISDSKLNQITTSGKVANSATTATQANTANAIVARDASGNFTANIITANLVGNADTATTATTATNATNVGITDDTSTNSDLYLTYVSSNSGNRPIKTSSTKLTINPSTGLLKASAVTTTGDINVGGNLVITGGLTVNGTTTTVNSTTLAVTDKNIELGNVSSPTDTTANGGGITLHGTTDKTLNWVSTTPAWTSSEHFDLASGKTYKIAGTTVLSSSQVLGKTIGGTSSGDIADISTAQTLTNKTISGANNTLTIRLANDVTGTLPIANGGTGATTASAAAAALLPSQSSNSGKYLTTDGSGTLSWASVSGYSAPTLGTTSIASGSTVTTIAGLTLSGATLTGTLTANGSAGTNGYYLQSTGTGVQWAAVAGYSAPTIGSTSIASGSTVTTIAGLTLNNQTMTGTVTAGGSAGTSGQFLQSTGSGVQWATPSSSVADGSITLAKLANETKIMNIMGAW